MQAHELMRIIIKSLGAKHVAGILGKCLAQVYRYATPPNTNPDTPWSPSVISRVDEIVGDLVSFGDLRTARLVAGRWVHQVGCRMVDAAPVRPNRETLEQECLDDLPALVALHNAVRSPSSDPVAVIEMAEAAKREIDETVEKRLEMMKAEER